MLITLMPFGRYSLHTHIEQHQSKHHGRPHTVTISLPPSLFLSVSKESWVEYEATNCETRIISSNACTLNKLDQAVRPYTKTHTHTYTHTHFPDKAGKKQLYQKLQWRWAVVDTRDEDRSQHHHLSACTASHRHVKSAEQRHRGHLELRISEKRGNWARFVRRKNTEEGPARRKAHWAWMATLCRQRHMTLPSSMPKVLYIVLAVDYYW